MEAPSPSASIKMYQRTRGSGSVKELGHEPKYSAELIVSSPALVVIDFTPEVIC